MATLNAPAVLDRWETRQEWIDWDKLQTSSLEKKEDEGEEDAYIEPE